ncbi:MAG: MmcQ-like protein [Flavobacteriales bacterium]|nr:MAG: MmcQ-like protein [Flavobacteriales bacterium]
MNIEEYRNYCISKKGVTESTPFPKLQDVLVFKVMDKMFTATSISTFDSISIKCVPDNIEELRANYNAVNTQAYMSKKHWCNVIMDGSIPDSLLYQWLDTSYNLVVKNLTKQHRIKLEC